MGKRDMTNYMAVYRKKLKRKLKGMSRKEGILILCAGIFVLVGAYFVLAPTNAKVARKREQEKLTKVIMSGGETMEIKADADDGVMTFYEDEAEEMDHFGEAPAEGQHDESDSSASGGENAEKPEKTEVVGLGMLEIEKIDLRLPVAEGTGKSTLKVAAGHVRETAAVGEKGNAVLAGHRSYTRGEFFNRLDELEKGDKLRFTARDGTAYVFEVIEIKTLEPSDSSVFDIRADKSDLTLYTCTPVRTASHRLAVRCTLVDKIA